jgi:hypothetical protein
MGHPLIDNLTPYAFEAAYSADEGGRPLFVPIVKGTYQLAEDGSVGLASSQKPVSLTGELYGKPGESSYKFEPEYAFFKPATDVVLIGYAHARNGGATETRVRLRAGALDRTVRVTGDRYWFRSMGVIMATPPESFEKIPLVYERAFGGWDRSHPDPEWHACEPRNPVGTGYRSKHGRFEDGLRLPNLEDPSCPLREYGDAPPPSGFGFTSSDWQPRASFGGTYDDKWKNQRMPMLPADFDRRFFNAASSGLVAPGYFQGGEPVSVEGASPGAQISFRLPVQAAPECRVQLTGRRDATIEMKLDTVVIDTDERLLMLTWRGHLVLRNGPHDVASIRIHAEGSARLTPVR